jgi:hypothetical protein
VRLAVFVFVGVFFLQDVVQFVQLVEYLDAVASIRVLAGFDDPDVFFFFLFVFMLLLFFLLHLGVAFALLFDRLVILEELRIFRVFDTISNMKGQRNNVVYVFINQLVVIAQVVKQCLLVADKMVELKMIVHADSLEKNCFWVFAIGVGFVVTVCSWILSFLLFGDYWVEVVLWEVRESLLECVELLRVGGFILGEGKLVIYFLVEICEHFHVVFFRQRRSKNEGLLLFQWIFFN